MARRSSSKHRTYDGSGRMMGVDWIEASLQAGLQQVRCTGLYARLILVSYHEATSRDRARGEFFYPLLSLPSDDPLQRRRTSSVRFGRSKPLLSTSVRVSPVDASRWSTRPPSMDLPTSIDLYPGTGPITTPATFSARHRKYWLIHNTMVTHLLAIA